MTSPKALILAGYGLNCEEETLHAFEPVRLIGHIAYSTKLNIQNILSVELNTLDEAYKSPLRGY